MRKKFGEYLISDEKKMLSPARIKGFLNKTYWAPERTLATVKESIKVSDCYGVYHNGLQVGFARVVTDGCTVFWLCDVVIDPGYRGRGLSKVMVGAALGKPAYAKLLGILVTHDAHTLYERYGFKKDPDIFMLRLPLSKKDPKKTIDLRF